MSGCGCRLPSWADAEYIVQQHKLVMNFNVDALFKILYIENSNLERGKELLAPKPILALPLQRSLRLL